MSGAVMHSGQWRIKPSGKLPIFLRFMINSSFTKENARKAGIKTVMENRVYLNHMMYWPANEYNEFEKEVIGHLQKNDGWFAKYSQREQWKAERLYNLGFTLKKTEWIRKTNKQITRVLERLLQSYRELTCPWYAQYPLDEYFEGKIEEQLLGYIPGDDPNFRHYVLTFADPQDMTDVAEERWRLVKLAQEFFRRRENLNRLSAQAKAQIEKHLEKFAYINRGLATSKPYTLVDIVARMKEIQSQVKNGQKIDNLIYLASQKKIEDDFAASLKRIQPRPDFQRIIKQARLHSYVRNRRVEAFFNADYGASFMYAEIARRADFNPGWIMEVSISEMIGALAGKPLPAAKEMRQRFKNYAMVVRRAHTKLITDPKEIKKLEKTYFVGVTDLQEIHGKVACIGGIVKGRAKICLDKHEIGKVKTGDILVTQFTTPDFVPAMERAGAIVADQGGLSSHAAIVSRELGVPCVIATKNGTRIIKDNDLLEVDTKKGIVRILERAK